MIFMNKTELQIIKYKGLTLQFPASALTGTDAPVVPVSVFRQDGMKLHYQVYNQRKQNDEYLSHHGCSLCAAATLAGAFTSSEITPFFLADRRASLLYDGTEQRLAGLPGPLSRSSRMPLNIAGISRLLSHFMQTSHLDHCTDAQLRQTILSKASQGIPILATGKRIPSLSGADLCPRGAHTFLIIGMKDDTTVIAADSAGSNNQRIKYADIDAVVSGILRHGVNTGLTQRRYYYGRGVTGGILFPTSTELPTHS